MVEVAIPNALMITAFIWTLIWKGIALWKSARKKQLYWFLAFLILNTLGLLPIIYLLVSTILEKKKRKPTEKKKEKKKKK